MSTSLKLANKKTASSDTSKQMNGNTQLIQKWNQCSSCGIIISKQYNEEHKCASNEDNTSQPKRTKVITNEQVTSLIGKQQVFLSANIANLKVVEHSKGENLIIYPKCTIYNLIVI